MVDITKGAKMRKIIVVPLVVIAAFVFAIVYADTSTPTGNTRGGIQGEITSSPQKTPSKESEPLPAYTSTGKDSASSPAYDTGVVPEKCKCTYIVEKEFYMYCNWDTKDNEYECEIQSAGFQVGSSAFSDALAKCDANDIKISEGFFVRDARKNKSADPNFAPPMKPIMSPNKTVVNYAVCVQY